MSQVLFFAVKDDLLPVLELVEAKGALRYARMGIITRHEIRDGISAFDTGAEIPNLGKASADSAAACDAFLVFERETPVSVRPLQGERVCMDQLANPDSIEFKPGGIWNEDVVLHGRIATASDSAMSKALMRRFQAAVKKSFVKVKSFYVGPKALALLDSGKRLTISAHSPREFDLTLGHETGT